MIRQDFQKTKLLSINQSINQSITLLRINYIHITIKLYNIQIHHNVEFECGFLLERVYMCSAQIMGTESVAYTHKNKGVVFYFKLYKYIV